MGAWGNRVDAGGSHQNRLGDWGSRVQISALRPIKPHEIKTLCTLLPKAGAHENPPVCVCTHPIADIGKPARIGDIQRSNAVIGRHDLGGEWQLHSPDLTRVLSL